MTQVLILTTDSDLAVDLISCSAASQTSAMSDMHATLRTRGQFNMEFVLCSKQDLKLNYSVYCFEILIGLVSHANHTNVTTAATSSGFPECYALTWKCRGYRNANKVPARLF